MKAINLILGASFLVLTAYAGDISADNYMYKWKSSDGEIHYTERPPAPGVAFEKIRVADKGKAQAGMPADTVIQDKASKKAKTAKEEDSYSGWRKENCKIAMQNLDILQNAGRIAQDDGQGGTRLMTDEEKAEKIKKMVAQRDKYCAEENN